MGVVGNDVFLLKGECCCYVGVREVVRGGFGGYREHLLRVSFFHGPPARVGLLLQASRGRHAQLQARGVDNLGPGAIEGEILFERVDDVVERRRLARGLANHRPHDLARNRLFYRAYKVAQIWCSRSSSLRSQAWTGSPFENLCASRQ